MNCYNLKGAEPYYSLTVLHPQILYYMDRNNYLPKEDEDKLSWLNNFIEKIQEYASTLGFSNTETIVIEQDIQKFRSLLRIKIEYHQSQSLYGLRGPVNPSAHHPARAPGKTEPLQSQVPEWMCRNLSKTVQKIKENSAYSEAIGIEFGLERAGAAKKEAPDFTNITSSVHIQKKKEG
jgi:hypothetical protein